MLSAYSQISKNLLTWVFLVELPGIEPPAEVTMTCGNIGSGDAKVRETTRNDLRIRESC
jgi:hypothetical protein